MAPRLITRTVLTPALSPGWSLLDNVIIQNGTLFIVTNEPKEYLDPYYMFSTGKPMLSEPESWPGKDPTEKEIQIINTTYAQELFGDQASRIEGVTFFCNDAPQCQFTLTLLLAIRSAISYMHPPSCIPLLPFHR